MLDLVLCFVNFTHHFCVTLQEGTVDKSSLHARLKLTIPREPDLETAHRAQRIRFISAILTLSINKCLSYRLLDSFI